MIFGPIIFAFIIMFSSVTVGFRCLLSRNGRIAFSTRRLAKPSARDPAYRLKAEEGKARLKDRPFTLPPGEHKPKQSLGQNYLSDQNYVLKICDAFQDESEDGHRVVEIGPGLGALTRVLLRKYPKMTAIEIDKRSVRVLNEKLPELQVVNEDILQFDWAKLAEEKGGKLNVIANLPYYITSQVLFGLADAHKVINKAVVTMQWEVGERVTATPGNKDYGIPSVVFQLYGKTQLNFKIPPKVFFPVPKVDSALVTIDFSKPHKLLHQVEPEHLRKVVTLAFRQRRKMLRQSLKELLEGDRVVLPAKWSTLRPEQIKPAQFLELTLDMYGRRGSEVSQRVMRAEQIKTDKKAQAKAGSAGALKRAAASVDSTVNDPETSRQLVDVQSAVELYPEKVGRGEGGALPTGTRLATLLRQRSLWGTTTTTTAAGDGGAMKGGEKITEAPVGVKNATDEVKQLPVVEYKVDAVWRKTFTYAI